MNKIIDDYSFVTLSALGPLSPSTTSKLTLSPSAIVTSGMRPVA